MRWFVDDITDSLDRSNVGYSQHAIKEMRLAPRIRIDDVSHFYFSGTDKEIWMLDRDFPFMIPPFDCVWLESRSPSVIVSEQHGVVKWGMRPQRTAVLVRRMDARHDLKNDIAPEYAKTHPYLPEGTRHILFASTWGDYNGRFSGPSGDGSLILMLNSEGSPVFHRLDSGELAEYFIAPERIAARLAAAGVSIDEARSQVRALVLDPAFLALSFLNCRGSEIRETAGDRHFIRNETRANRPTSKYYVLAIPAIRSAVVGEQTTNGTSLTRALHICRGNFATYTDDHPLFGKLTGRFWRPSHTRGKVDAGVVVKDYSVVHFDV